MGFDHETRTAPGCPQAAQGGAALLVAMLLAVVVSATLLLHLLHTAPDRRPAREAATARSLAAAKRALVAWAVTVPSRAGRSTTPGLLPFPDRNRDKNYDGRGDCVTVGLNPSHLLGRFPWAGDARPCPPIGLHVAIRDGAGEPLWYAVSRNLVTRGRGGPINPDMGEAGRMRYPWIRLRDGRGMVPMEPGGTRPLPVAAVVIAPGVAIGDQARGGAAPPAGQYLDRVTVGGATYDNSDADGCVDAAVPPCTGASAGEEFVLHGAGPSDPRFNDRLAYVSVDELVRAVQRRVLGEVAAAMNAYRRAHGAYPWLAGFRSPVVVASGIADGGSATHLHDGRARFTDPAYDVRLGDAVINLTDGGRGIVTTIRGSTLGFGELNGGIENDFDTGEAYRIEPSFKSDRSRHGLLPVHLENEVFATGLRVSWHLADATPTTTTGHTGDPRLVPPLAATMTGSIRVPRALGRCRWRDWSVGDCVGVQTTPGHYRADLGRAVRRTVEVALHIVDPGPAVTAPTSTDVRRRTLRASGARLSASPAARGRVRIRDEDGALAGAREIVIDADTGGTVRLGGIRYDLSVVYDGVADARDELPEWFVDNAWHHYVHGAFSADAVAGGNADGDDDCETPTDSCLTLNVAGLALPRRVRALLVGAGVALANQDRSVGDCDGDGAPDGHLCAYLEGDNQDRSSPTRADTYNVGRSTVGFNDQVRVIDPPSP